MIVQFGYDNANRRTSLTLPNGILVEYAYDATSQLTGITYKQNGITVLGDLTYEYDKNGNRTKIGGSFARTGIPQGISSTAYNVANHQTIFDNKTLTYDNNGNLTSVSDGAGTTTYTWNARNQLVGISGPTVTASFVYDGLGRRQQKTINGNSTEFLYDGVNPVQETSGAAILANILPGLGIDEFLTRTDVVAGTTSNFLTDALGSPIAVTDTAGTVQTEYTYEPFGKTTTTGASSTNPYQYTGRENDSTGLYYYRARYYSPQLQRFISEDPIEFYGGDVNLYAYVANSSLNYVDPFGLDKKPKPGMKSSPPWGPPLGPDTPPPAGPLPPDCPLGACFGGNRSPNTPQEPTTPQQPPAPDNRRDPEEDLQDLFDRACDFMAAACEAWGGWPPGCKIWGGLCKPLSRNPRQSGKRR